MKRILLPALVVLVVVTSFVGLAGWNQSGVPRLTIVLTERELALAGNAGASPGDDPGMRLRLGIAHRSEPLDARNWLPEERLRALGFPLNRPLGDPAAADAYLDLPPRVAWIALEYDGPAWREIERRRAVQRQGEGWREFNQPSRLVPVDAALDFADLAARYPEGHLIVRAVIAVSYVDATRGGPLVYGWVRQIVPDSIAVPHRLRPVLEGLPERRTGSGVTADNAVDLSPRYDVELAIGRLGLPYIRGVRRLR